MTPFDHAIAVYSREPCARTFSEDLEAHLRFGFVVSTPECFLMMRKVIAEAPYREITDPWMKFNSSMVNCWHIYLFSGDIRKAFDAADVQLPYVSFERRNKLRFYTWGKIFDRTERLFKS